ncbi:MAG: hypothetical protein LJE68_13635, partial [Rhodobacter sp.]|nr:hypothetical protein [Rhodobacter sp.]
AEEGWLDLISPAFSASLKAGELVITITLDGDDPPIVPADADLHGPEYPPDAPVLEVLVDFAGAGDAAAQTFAILRNATRTAPQIKTDASGLRQMSIRTDNGVADPSAKFMPFGPQPREGARWVIGSAEVFSRALASLDINVTWAEPYDDGDYFLVKPASDYGVLFEFLTGGTWRAGDVYPAPLDLENTTVATISAKGLYKASSDAELVAEDAPITARSRSGFLRMTLNTDFGHAEYIDKKTVALIDKSKETPDGPQDTATYNYDADDVPEEPYTPEITEISLSYESLAATAQRTYLLHPFGIEPVSGTARIFPDLPYGGALFVGVADLDPPQRLSLLAEVANGTGDPLLEAPELEHGWLGAQGWTAFEKQEVDDRTTNLAGSGILAFAMPQTASDQGGLMPAGLHWVRIAAPVNAAAVNDLISVDAQAIRATFADSRNDPAFVATPLPSGTIAKLRSPDPAIKGLRQPYSSFGGRGQEDRLDYHRRASERLRHKDRAVTVWDHEHIALEALPSIYRVKALNHTELVRLGGVVMGDNELSPGAVTVVAIPYTDTISHPNPLRPYTDRATLARLHETIAGRCSPFVRLEAANPKFEEVHVEMNVAFLPDIADTDFYRAQIEAALIEHLTPWQQRGARGAEFNGIVYKSTVIDFVEELPYVDFLEDVKLYHRPSPEVPTWTPVDAEIIRAKTARSILVSAPTHTIGLV